MGLDVGKEVQRGMTPKKLHEVTDRIMDTCTIHSSLYLEQVGCLAGLVVDVCARNGCQLVLDVGSGLVRERCLCVM